MAERIDNGRAFWLGLKADRFRPGHRSKEALTSCCRAGKHVQCKGIARKNHGVSHPCGCHCHKEKSIEVIY